MARLHDCDMDHAYRKNEEIDDKLMIKRLRKRIAELESELARQQAAQVGLGES